jgi:hypothetical protein
MFLFSYQFKENDCFCFVLFVTSCIVVSVGVSCIN